ncbi:MAG: hypothetical protein ABI207_03645 [Crocinitomicaceae bacterium]
MIEAIVTIVTTLTTAFVTWFFARRLHKAEAKSKEIDNAQKNAEYYQKLVDDWVLRYQKVVLDLDKAAETIKAQIAEIEKLMSNVYHLTEELKKYKQLNGKA